MTKVALRKLQGPYTLNLVEHCTGVAEIRVQILSKEMFFESPEKSVVKLESALFEKLILLHVLNVRKTKRTAKFDGLESRRCEAIKGIMAFEICRKVSGLWRNSP